MSHTATLYRRIVVQRAAAWPANDGGWTTVGRAMALNAEEALAPDFGGAQITMAVGKHRQPGQATVAAAGPDTNLLSRYVRMLKQDASGSVSLTLNGTTENYLPFWWGKVVDISEPRWSALTADGISTGFAVWSCVGILLDLHVQPDRGFELGSTGGGSVVADSGTLLGFNVEPAGDRSVLTYTVGSVDTYVHDRRSPGNPWTARTAVGLLLAARRLQGGPPWALSGQVDALAYIETWDTPGLTILERLNRILSQRRGIAVRPVVRNHIPYLHISTTSPVRLTVGAYTLPAAEEQTNLDLRGQATRTVTRFVRDARAQLDVFDLEGRRPWLCRTFTYKADGTGDFVQDWTPAEYATWLVSSSTARRTPALAHVGRRFRLRSDPQTAWVNNVRSTTTSDVYGTDGEDGTQTADLAQGIPVNALRFTRTLPLYEGVDYTSSIPSSLTAGGDFQKPRAFWIAGSTYMDISARFPIEVIDGEPAVLLGETPEDAAELLATLPSFDGLAVTVGVLEPLPVRVRWRRAPGSWPSTDAPRRRSYPIEAELWRLAAGTVLKGGNTGDTATGGTIRDDRSRMRQALVLGRPWVEFADVDLEWIEAQVADVVDTFHPGVFLADLLSADGTDAVDQVITRRGWDLTEAGLQTRYSAKRIPADLRGIAT